MDVVSSEERIAGASADAPLVSVIVPVYNASATLDQALSSIEHQTLARIEVLCLNDGSTDESPAIIREHAARDPRIRMVDKENQGYGATCNRGIREARGTWIAIVEPDDWIEPSMFERMLSFERSFQEKADIVKTPYWRIVDPDTPRQRKLQCRYKGRVLPKKQPFAVGDGIELIAHHPSIWSALYRRAFLEEHDIKFREYPGAGWADNPFLLETLVQTDRIVYLDEPFYCYREETEEKSRRFYTGSPTLPLDRWNDMTDVLEKTGTTDVRILSAHIKRGFTYLESVLDFVSLDDNAKLQDAVKRTFERMDETLVMQNPGISPTAKALYRTVLGLPAEKVSSWPYRRYLACEGLYTLRTNGMKSVVCAVRKRVLKR